MAIELTLVCDSCSVGIDSGSRDAILATLRAQGGRAFDQDRPDGPWREVDPAQPWGRARRHLCGACSDATVFYDLEPVPPRAGHDTKGA